MDLPCTSGRPAMYLARDHAAGAGRRGRRRGRGRRVHRRSMPGTRQAGARDTAGLREVHGGWPDGAPFPVASLTWSPCMDHHATPPGAATTAGTGGYPDGPLDALDAADAAFRPLASGLCWAAWRAGQAHAYADSDYAARRRVLSVWRDGPELPWGHPDFVLAAAVRRGILSAGQAELIGRNRLEGVPLSQIAAEQNIGHTALCMRRKRAEKAITDAIRHS